MLFPVLHIQFIDLPNKLRGHLLQSVSDRDIILISHLHYLLLHLLDLIVESAHRGDILLRDFQARAYRVDPFQHTRVLITCESLHHDHLVLQVLNASIM